MTATVRHMRRWRFASADDMDAWLRMYAQEIEERRYEPSIEISVTITANDNRPVPAWDGDKA